MIITRHDTDRVKVQDIPSGGVFEFNGDLCIKTDTTSVDRPFYIEAIGLKDGIKHIFKLTEEVRYIENAELIVN